MEEDRDTGRERTRVIKRMQERWREARALEETKQR